MHGSPGALAPPSARATGVRSQYLMPRACSNFQVQLVYLSLNHFATIMAGVQGVVPDLVLRADLQCSLRTVDGVTVVRCWG